MIFATLGPSSPHAELVFDLIKWIIEHCLGDVQEISSNEANGLRLELSNRRNDTCILRLTVPDREVVQSIIRNAVPGVLIIRPFEELCCFAMSQGGQDLANAIRQTTHAISRLHSATKATSIAALSIDDDEALLLLAIRLGISLGFQFGETEAGQILSGHFPNWESITIARAVLSHVPAAKSLVETREALSLEDRKLLLEMGKSYAPLLLQGVDRWRLSWPLQTMFNAEPPYPPLAGPLRLLGPARIMTFGPYFHLPEGNWLLKLTFSVAENYSGNQLKVDVYSSADRVLAVTKGDLPEGGTFKTRLSFSILSSDERIEIRTFILSGAIEGRIELLSVVLEPESL